MVACGTLTMANSAATNSAFSITSRKMMTMVRSLSTALLPLVLAVALAARGAGHDPGGGVVEHALLLQLHALDAHPLAHRGNVPQFLGDAPAQGVALALEVGAQPGLGLVHAQP